MPEYIMTYESWDFFCRCVVLATDEDYWEDFSDFLHSGHAAIYVNGTPRLIHGTIN